MNRRETFDPDAVELARAVPIKDEIARRGINLSWKRAERVGSCPKCGGTDRAGHDYVDRVGSELHGIAADIEAKLARDPWGRR
jgi:hypothetical protein